MRVRTINWLMALLAMTRSLLLLLAQETTGGLQVILSTKCHTGGLSSPSFNLLLPLVTNHSKAAPELTAAAAMPREARPTASPLDIRSAAHLTRRIPTWSKVNRRQT